MLLLNLGLLFVCIVSARVAVGIAPGDGDPVCTNLRSMDINRLEAPNYDRGQSILMDSWNYEYLLGRVTAAWVTVDNDTSNGNPTTDTWTQQTNTPCVGAVTVCGFKSGEQSNWLITQRISRTVNGVQLPQVNVLIEFELQTCSTDLRCQRTFSVYIYETSEDANRRDISRYRQIRRVSADSIDGTLVNETVPVDFNTNNSSFYLAIRDETTCITVSRIIVFYGICPRQVQDKVVFPETIAPALGASLVTVNAMCIENAELVGDSPTKLVCSGSQNGGRWTVLTTGGCRCVRGAFFADGACVLCRIGTYFSPSNNSCSECPANSVSERDGLAQCNCTEGYYRATTGEEDQPCRLPPPAPLNVRISDETADSITVSWDAPGQNLTYNVYTSLDGQARILVAANVSGTTYTIPNLLAGRSYTVSVSTATSFSDQVPFSSISSSLEGFTTGSGGPDTTPIIIAVVVVVFFIIGAVVAVILFIIWMYRKANAGSKQLIAQYHEVAELAETGGRKMYVDPSIYASPDEAVRDFAKEIPPKFLTVKEEIGRGEFGAVYKGIWKSGGKQVPIAIKTLKPHSSAKQRNDFLAEASIMGQFTHPNVVKLYGVVTVVEPVMIVMEFLENGSLHRYLRTHDEKLSMECLLKMAKGVAQGMDYLSVIGFVHRDLAARNILVSKNEVCKVADFGLSRETVDDIYKVNKGGKIPVRWTAPEAIYRRKFTTSSDVWSYGVLLWEIMSYGQTPYDDMDNQELLDKLDDGYRLEKPHNTPEEVYQLMLDCWDDDHIRRPTFAIIEQRVDEILTSNSVKPPPKKPKTYSYSSAVVDSPLDYKSVNEWLDGLKMGKYKPNFEERGITTTNEVLALDEQQLRKMDITLAGHISKIKRSIAMGNQKLGREPSMRV